MYKRHSKNYCFHEFFSFSFSCVRYVIINSMMKRTIILVSRSWYYHHHHYHQNYSSNIGQIDFTYIINMTSYYSREEAQYMSFFASPPPPPPSPHRPNVLVAFIFPMMVGFIQLMYQATNNKSPFELHPKKMYLAIASFLIYCFSYDAQLRLIPSSSNHCHRYSNYVKMVQFVGSIFGPLTLASYSSVLVPSLGPFLFSVSFLYSVILLFNSTILTKRLNWVYHKLMNYFCRTPCIIPV